MKDIYAQAKRVLIFLGHGENHRMVDSERMETVSIELTTDLRDTQASKPTVESVFEVLLLHAAEVRCSALTDLLSQVVHTVMGSPRTNTLSCCILRH
jgi:hypothetical protein